MSLESGVLLYVSWISLVRGRSCTHWLQGVPRTQGGVPIVKIEDFASAGCLILLDRLPFLGRFETDKDFCSLTVVSLLRQVGLQIGDFVDDFLYRVCFPYPSDLIPKDF
jgi:hypothetical protein